MPPRPAEPLLNRLLVMRCRLTYAQQRIRELEALAAEHGVTIPPGVTAVPPLSHRCIPGMRLPEDLVRSQHQEGSSDE